MTSLDYIVIAVYFGITLSLGLALSRKAGRSMEEFFLGGRKLPWWLSGISMVATTFAADTPLAVTGIVALSGISGNWVWWSFAASGMLTVVFFSRLWRRAGVLTDAELIELRYGGKPASWLRSFRAIYLSIGVNTLILGWVSVGMAKVIETAFGWPKWETLIALYAITGLYLAASGMWGVVWTDFFQFFLAMGGSIALALLAVDKAGSLEAIKVGVSSLHGADFMRMNPFNSENLAMTAFAWLFLQWWASWYPGAEPGGGGYIAQRIFSTRSEKEALKSALLFNILHYVARPWPWIIVALASLIYFPGLEDPEKGYPEMMLALLPSGLLGLVLAGFLAAFMSTLSTHINWGVSYLVNDIYKRHARPGAAEREYVMVSRLSTILILALSFVMSYLFDSVKGAWEFLLAIGAGTGPVYILRWFWMRVNAWSEISASLAAVIISLFIKYYYDFALGETLVATTLFTTLIWVGVTFLTPAESPQTIAQFRARIYRDGAMFPDGFLRRALLWVSGTFGVYFLLTGSFYCLFYSMTTGLLLMAGGVVLLVPLWRFVESLEDSDVEFHNSNSSDNK